VAYLEEDPSEAVAYLEEDPSEAVAYLEEGPLEAVAYLEGLPKGGVAFLVETVQDDTVVEDFVYNLADLGSLQDMEAASFAHLSVANDGREVAAPQALRCIGNSLSRHNCNSLRLGALLSSVRQCMLLPVTAHCGPIADKG
jgi:hypothetical protein